MYWDSIDANKRKKRDYDAPALATSICVRSVKWHSYQMAMLQRRDGRPLEGINE